MTCKKRKVYLILRHYDLKLYYICQPGQIWVLVLYINTEIVMHMTSRTKNKPATENTFPLKTPYGTIHIPVKTLKKHGKVRLGSLHLRPCCI